MKACIWAAKIQTQTNSLQYILAVVMLYLDRYSRPILSQWSSFVFEVELLADLFFSITLEKLKSIGKKNGLQQLQFKLIGECLKLSGITRRKLEPVCSSRESSEAWLRDSESAMSIKAEITKDRWPTTLKWLQ